MLFGFIEDEHWVLLRDERTCNLVKKFSSNRDYLAWLQIHDPSIMDGLIVEDKFIKWYESSRQLQKLVAIPVVLFILFLRFYVF